MYALYLSIDTSKPLVLEPADKPFITGLVYREGRRTAVQEAAEWRLVEAGMQFFRQKVEYSFGYLTKEQDQAGRALLAALEEKGFRFAPLERARARQAHALLLESIGSLNVCGFEMLDWDSLCREDAFQVTDRAGALCAVTVLPRGFAGGLSATAPDCRRQGLGKALKYYGYYVGGHIRQHDHLWVADWNRTNIDIITGLGARDTSRRARQYVLPARKPAG